MSLPAALLHYLCHFVVAVISVVSFGISFHVPRRHYLACGLTGAVGWIVYLLCLNLLHCSAPVSVLVATLPLAALARVFAIRHKAPLTVFCSAGFSLWCPVRVSTTRPIIFCRMTAPCLPTQVLRR